MRKLVYSLCRNEVSQQKRRQREPSPSASFYHIFLVLSEFSFDLFKVAYTGPRAPSARSISPTLPERSPTIPRAVLEERPCQPRRRAEPGISHRSRGWGCRWQSKQSPVIECDSGKSVIPPAWHRRFPRIPVPLHAGSSNPIQGHRGNRRD